MSRTSVAATWYPCDASTPQWVPIGRPIRNVRTYVLDEELNSVPVGDTGQMYLAGAGLARGYLGHPGRTAASFLPDPFAERPGERMCATGDNVRLQPDGNYVYVGRIDDQIKISGYRVEIGEVEHNLRACRGVVDAAALLREDTPGGAAIVAYLVGERRPDELLTSQLGSWLPAPMIPRVYVWLDEMPLNRAGKIDRRALAKMLDPALSHPDAIRNPHVVPFTCGGGTDTGSCPMPAEYTQGDQFRGARIHLCDLSGLEIRDCDVTGLKIVDCYGGNVSLGGGFERVVVNDVDVTAYVEAELDRLHPNRVLAREATSAAEYRAAWDAIEKQWGETLDRARRLPEAKLHEQVDGEWSFVETQRHLLMASDAWIGNAVLEEDAPYHSLGLPGGGKPAEASAKLLGLTLDAIPTLDEVLAPRLARMATMRRVVDELTEAELDRVCGRKPADPYPDKDYVVRRCLSVVLKEEAEHHRYAVRDLTVLEADARTE